MGAACAGAEGGQTIEKLPLGQVKIIYLKGLMSRGLTMAAILEVGQVDYKYEPIVDIMDFMHNKEKYSIWGFAPEMSLPDGTRIAEICAMCSLLGNYYPIIGGATPADNAISCMLGSRMNDLYSGLSNPSQGGTYPPGIALGMAAPMWQDKEQLPALQANYKRVMEKERPVIETFNDLCSADGKFTSTGTTWGEIFVWGFLEQFRWAKLGIVTPMPAKLAKFMERMDRLDGCKAALEGRTQFGVMARHIIDMAQF